MYVPAFTVKFPVPRYGAPPPPVALTESVVFPPKQEILLPATVITGRGSTVTVMVFELADEHALVADPVTQYDVAVDAAIVEVVAPVFHVKDVAPLAVNITLVPGQMLVLPPAVIVGEIFIQQLLETSLAQLQPEVKVDVRNSADCPEPGPGVQRATKPLVA